MKWRRNFEWGVKCLNCGSKFKHDEYYADEYYEFACPVCGYTECAEVKIRWGYKLSRYKHILKWMVGYVGIGICVLGVFGDYYGAVISLIILLLLSVSVAYEIFTDKRRPDNTLDKRIIKSQIDGLRR